MLAKFRSPTRASPVALRLCTAWHAGAGGAGGGENVTVPAASLAEAGPATESIAVMPRPLTTRARRRVEWWEDMLGASPGEDGGVASVAARSHGSGLTGPSTSGRWS